MMGLPPDQIQRVLDHYLYNNPQRPTNYQISAQIPLSQPHPMEPPKTISVDAVKSSKRKSDQLNNSSKRFEKNVRKILEKWMTDHWEYPYPDAGEEEQLISITKLKRRQIKTWMTNYRRRKMNLRRAKKQNNNDLVSMFTSAPQTLSMLRYSNASSTGNIPILWGTKEYSPGVVVYQDPASVQTKNLPPTCPPEKDVMEALECLFDSKEKDAWKKK